MITSVTTECGLSGLIIYGWLASEKMFFKKLPRNLILEILRFETYVLTFLSISYT